MRQRTIQDQFYSLFKQAVTKIDRVVYRIKESLTVPKQELTYNSKSSRINLRNYQLTLIKVLTSIYIYVEYIGENTIIWVISCDLEIFNFIYTTGRHFNQKCLMNFQW